MTEPNCKICLGEAEEELKRLQEEKVYREEAKKRALEESKRTGLPPFTEAENAFANYQSLTGTSTVDICPKCGIASRSLQGNAYLYRHQGIQTNIQKQIATKHCQPEQIKEFQQKKAQESILKNFNQESKTQPEQKSKLQKQQNFILGGILVSLVGLIGMGVYLVLKNKKGEQK